MIKLRRRRQYSPWNKRAIGLALFFLPFFFLPYSSYAAFTPLEIRAMDKDKGDVSFDENWFRKFTGFRAKIEEQYGIQFAFLANYAQQAIIKSKENEGRSRGAGYWNFEIAKKLWQGAELFTEFEGDWGKGVDKYLPTFSLFNSNAGDDASFYVLKLYAEQKLLDDKILLAAGKLDLSDWLDDNVVAASADTQFLSSALVGASTLPFPQKGLGALASFSPYEWLCFQAGASTAKASSTKTGLSDGFNSVFFINELDIRPKLGQLQGNYRFILNLNRERLDYIDSDESKKNDASWALSFDQAVTQRITLFFRYGAADPKVRDIEQFWSYGGQLAEPIPGRKFDILAFGVAQSIFGKEYRQANEDIAYSETLYETYYSFNVNSSVTLTPNIQVVTNPDGDKTAETEIVCGLRFLLSF